jgi:hypothetical protein
VGSERSQLTFSEGRWASQRVGIHNFWWPRDFGSKDGEYLLGWAILNWDGVHDRRDVESAIAGFSGPRSTLAEASPGLSGSSTESPISWLV